MPREELRLPPGQTEQSGAPVGLSPAAIASAQAHAPHAPMRGRREMHSDDIAIEQKASVREADDYDGEIVLTDRAARQTGDEWLDELAFMEEPVTIRIEPSTEKNAATVFPVWVNGKGAEVFQRDRWEEIGYLPVGRVITVKRKVLEVIVRAKVDTVQTTETEIVDVDRGLGNTIRRYTSAVHSFSVIEDKNPRGHAWLSEMRRRNF